MTRMGWEWRAVRMGHRIGDGRCDRIEDFIVPFGRLSSGACWGGYQGEVTRQELG